MDVPTSTNTLRDDLHAVKRPDFKVKAKRYVQTRGGNRLMVAE